MVVWRLQLDVLEEAPVDVCLQSLAVADDQEQGKAPSSCGDLIEDDLIHLGHLPRARR